MELPFTMTPTARRILGALADSPRKTWSWELAREAECGVTTVHHLLAKLRQAGWVKSEMDDLYVSGRRRRLHWLTEQDRERIETLLGEQR